MHCGAIAVTSSSVNAPAANPRPTTSANDIAVAGVPFDSGVTYRPGARFGPAAIRLAEAEGLGAHARSVAIRMNPGGPDGG